MGDTRRALRAGDSAASTVIPTPTAKATPTVRPAMRKGSIGNSPPSAPKMAFRAADTPIPPATPRPVATRPTATDSPSNERVTCVPVAPRARSSPSSRTRWPMRIENTLLMRKADTTTVMMANARRMYWKMLMKSSNAAPCSSATCSTVTTSSPEGRVAASAAATVSTSASLETSTRISSHPDPPLSSSVAVAMSNPANCAPPDLSSSGSPQFMVPTSSKVRVPAGRLTRYVSPTTSPSRSAVPASTVNSSLPAGRRPSATYSSDRAGSSDQLTPSCGGPTVSRGTPSASRITTLKAPTPPLTAATPSTAATSSARAGSTVGAFSRSPNSILLRTRRSICPAMSSAISSKAERRLSVTMNTPTTNDTARTTLSAVPRKRIFLATMFLRVRRRRVMASEAQSPSVLDLSSTLSTVGFANSSTILPSARKTARSL